jgi:dihydroxyacetone kinase
MKMPAQDVAYRGVLKKIINSPSDAVDEMLDGFVAAHGELVRLAAPRVVARRHAGGSRVE